MPSPQLGPGGPGATAAAGAHDHHCRFIGCPLFVTLAALLVTACLDSPMPSVSRVRLTSGIPGAGFYSLGAALSAAYDRAVPSIDVEVRDSAGSVDTLQLIQRGDADLGFAFADVTYVAFSRGIRPDQAAFDQLRAVAVLELTSLQLVVRGTARIRAVGELRGHTVGIGPTGSGTALTSGLVLRAYNIGDDELVTVELPWNEAARRLVAGTLDAAFVNAGYPSESIAEAVRGGGRLLELDGPAIDRLRSSYPFFRLTFIPRATYAGQREPVRTIGVNNLLVTRAGLDEQVVYDLTKALFEVFPDLATQRSSLELDPEQAPATPIPLHEGAVRYYRERELSR